MPSGDTDVVRQIVNQRRFNLQYGIESVDPSGVDRVILWQTQNGGRNWKALSTDPDNASPFPVEVPEEGEYGFRIVVHSKDGLTGRPPASGVKPDLLITVDTTRPQTQITSVPYGRGPSAGRMVINWRAYDEHLVTRPITIAYSPRRGGPWTTIVKGLRNTGNYIWKVEPHVPPQVYLKIEALDRAGNIGVHELDRLLDLSGLGTPGKDLWRSADGSITRELSKHSESRSSELVHSSELVDQPAASNFIRLIR